MPSRLSARSRRPEMLPSSRSLVAATSAQLSRLATYRSFWHDGRTALLAAIAVIALLLVTPVQMAQSSQVIRKPTTLHIEAAALIRSHSAAIRLPEGFDDRTCVKSRKRLWINGDGWVVRRVATCH